MSLGERPVLCLVTDRRFAGADLLHKVAAAVRGGVDWVQVRDRELEGEALLAHVEALGSAARDASSGRRVRVVVNRRLDVALAAQADGAHLGGDAVSPREARALLGGDALLGASTHHPDEACLAPRDLDYVHLAPIFDPLSKPAERPGLGLETLAQATRDGPPVIAQGGITAANARACCEAGAAGVAITGEILGAADPAATSAALREALDG